MSFMVITYFVGQMGVTSLATFSYAMQLSMIMMMLGISIGIGTEIMIGHMVGAGEFDMAYRQLLRSLRVHISQLCIEHLAQLARGVSFAGGCEEPDRPEPLAERKPCAVHSRAGADRELPRDR